VLFKKWFGRKEEPGKGPEPEGTAEPAEPRPEPLARASAWALFKKGLAKTRRGIAGLFTLRRELDGEFLDALEAELYAADFGPATVAEIIDGEHGVRAAWKERKLEDTSQVPEFIKERLRGILCQRDSRLVEAATRPTVVLVAGVNGTGKTTSIAKLAHLLKNEGKTVVLAAADTFRAAAVEQLVIWSQRLGIDIVTGEKDSDPASVAFRAAEHALAAGADYLIVDTAGRLHTQKNLMRELEKVRSVLGKKVAGAPHECLLVLDATTGQNALAQAQSFLDAIQVSGIVLTKLDGTAKGGIVVTINNRFQIPVKFVGVGEGVEDLEQFDAAAFVDALIDD
jgi:fused signal recognition particle receptor